MVPVEGATDGEARGAWVAGLGAGAAATGLLGIAGWVFGLQSLKTVVPGLVAIKFNAAAGLVMAGSSLALLAWSPRTPGVRVAGSALAAAVLALGVASGSQDLIGWELGIDPFLFTEPAGSPFTAHPGRMALPTSACFVLAGVGLALAWIPASACLRGILAAGIALTACASAARYLAGEPGVLAGGGTPMPLVTAPGFLLLAGGLLATAARRPAADGVPPRLPLVELALAVALLLAGGGAALVYGVKARETGGWVGHTWRVLAHLLALASEVDGIAASGRALVAEGASGDRWVLDTHRMGAARELNALLGLTRDNPDQQARLDRLSAAMERHLDDLG